MASFNEALKQSTLTRSSNVCALVKWRTALDAEARTEFDTALANPANTHSNLYRAMRSLGYEAGLSTVGRHRNGECTCGSL